MTTIYANFRPSSGAAPTGAWLYNDFVDAVAIGTLSADLKDDTNAVTGVSVAIATNPFGGASGGSINATADSGLFLENILDYYNYFAIASPVDLVFSGLPANTSVTFTATGWPNRTDRNTTFGIGGATSLYDISAGSPSAVPAPVSVVGTTDGSGNLTVNLTASAVFGYINGFILEYTTGPSYTITSIDGDNNVQAGQPNVDIVMTATTGVTSVTLGGETLTINGVS